MVKISIALTTCRESYGAMIGVEDWELFTPTIESLKKQTMMDFELVIVDALHHERPDRFKNVDYPFKVKHIPFTREESRWLKRGIYNNVQQRNKGLIYADGELVVFAADCCEFSSQAMELYWYWYKKELMPQAVFRYNKGGKPLTDKKGKLVKDHRWEKLDKSPTGKMTYTWTNWFREYGAAPMRALLKINGFDELFDGQKGLEDVEIGMRLSLIGYTKYVLDQHLYVIENCHYSIPKRLFGEEHKLRGDTPVKSWKSQDIKHYKAAFKDPYSIMLYKWNHQLWKANSDVLSDATIEEIKQHSLSLFANGTLEGDPIIWEKSPHFHYWKSRQPVFSLKELRDERIARGE